MLCVIIENVEMGSETAQSTLLGAVGRTTKGRIAEKGPSRLTVGEENLQNQTKRL